MTTFQKLTKKEKVEHIWEYYRYHIIGGVLGVFMLGSLLIQVFGPQPPEPAASVVVMGIYAHDEDKVNQLKQAMKDIVQTEEGGQVELTMHQVDWDSSSPMDMAMNQKLMIMFEAKEIDVMIIEESRFDLYVDNVEYAMYEPLEDQPVLKETLEANPESIAKRRFQEDTSEKIYGLYAKDSKKLKDIGLGDNFIVSVPVVSTKMENAFKVIKWLYE